MNQQKKNWGIFFVLLWVLVLTIPALTFSQESNQPATTTPGSAPAAPAETPLPPAVTSAPSVAAPVPQAKLDKGIDWLGAHQREGAWPANYLNKMRDPQDNIGKFMRDAATAFAVLALTEP